MKLFIYWRWYRANRFSRLSPKEFYKILGKFKLENSKAFDIAFNEDTEGRFCKQYDIFKNTGIHI
ncbi:hypothetical protein [uncultured Gammaproteobacteria bacterium]|nr:hypothetical protein [uncultured Gammaproteobacteria bacterium]CAC9607013.1 hypothetical protein [uncultured Gammaproteobacteria bacterium]